MIFIRSKYVPIQLIEESVGESAQFFFSSFTKNEFETRFRPQVLDIVEYFLIRFCDSKPSNIDDLESLGSTLLKSWIIPFLNWNSKNQFKRLLSDMKAFKHIEIIITRFLKEVLFHPLIDDLIKRQPLLQASFQNYIFAF